MLLKVTPSQKYAYVFADSFALSFDIINNRIIELRNISTLWYFPSTVIPHAFDLTDKWAIVATFALVPNNPKIAIIAVFLCGLQPLRCYQYVIPFDNYTQSADLAITYNRDNDISISVSETRQMAIVGFAQCNTVSLFTINATNTNTSQWKINQIRIDIGPQINSGFGRSVAWINDTTVAIAILTINDRSWSLSEVWIYPIDEPFKTPLVIFPNNQQILALSPLPHFLQILSWSGHLYILTDIFRVLLIPSREPGYHSVWYNSGENLVFIFDSLPCIGGTYKKEFGCGWCTVCPPHTKNPGIEPCSECSSCSSNSFCPLGSIDNVLLDNYSSYTQTFSYPDSPDMNNYDDILVHNIFILGNSTQCLIISPLFWTLLAMGLCFIIWSIMTIGKVYNCRHRERAKNFLKKTDIVGDGDRWIGGLFSFAIVILFGFTTWFAVDYLQLYPIETSRSVQASCDDTMRNAVFDNALQLALPNLDGSRWIIFDMLDKQPFTMTIDLINTRADCSNITIQQNRPGVNYLIIPILSCIIQSDNVTSSVTFALSTHRLTLQLNVTGAYFIGGIRLCLHGPSLINGTNTLQTLDVCNFFSTTNETLARITTLSIILTKVVNQTKPLRTGDDTLYSGRWAPTIIGNTLSDKLIYEQNGDYLRYMTQRTIFMITLDEQPFFLQNNQQPIVRVAELAFHTLLFGTLIIELFAIAFLIFKLIFMPLIRLIIHCRHRTKNNIDTITDQSSSSYTISQAKSSKLIKKRFISSLSNFEIRRLFRNYERKKQRHQNQRKNFIDDIPQISSNRSHKDHIITIKL